MTVPEKLFFLFVVTPIYVVGRLSQQFGRGEYFLFFSLTVLPALLVFATAMLLFYR